MNAQAAYLIVRSRMLDYQAEAEHDRLARDATVNRRGVLKRVASKIRRFAGGLDESLTPPQVPLLTDYPYRS